LATPHLFVGGFVIKPYYDRDGVTIYCGDVRKVLPQIQSVDMIFTDPPYGHNNNDGDLIHSLDAALGKVASSRVTAETARPIAVDSFDEANTLVRFLFSEAVRVLAVGGGCCCCSGGGGPDPQFARWSLWMDEVLDFKQMVVWVKGGLGLGWHYHRTYEVVLVAQKRGGPCKWYDTSKKVANILRHIPKIIPGSQDHPTAKPVALPEFFIRLHSQAGEVVLDPFLGGGSTALAAKRLGRRVIGIDVDERWCKHTVDRISQRTLLMK